MDKVGFHIHIKLVFIRWRVSREVITNLGQFKKSVWIRTPICIP